jgi:hypothetical protein
VQAAGCQEGGAPCAVETLSGELLAVASLAVDTAATTIMSARLLEATLWALSRWADSYIFPLHNHGNLHQSLLQATVPNSLLHAFGADDGASHSPCASNSRTTSTLTARATSHWRMCVCV